MVFAPVHETSLARAAQLTQKTNQFNVTTVRYTEAELLERQADPASLVTTIQVRDRFGDNGIVGFMMARLAGSEMEIDTLLLSCRVIGRTVETAMLAHVCEHAARRGAQRVRGRIVLTSKNAPAQDLYDRHSFQRKPGDPGGATDWGSTFRGDPISGWMKIV